MTREEFIGLVPDVQEPLRRFLLVLCEGDAASADDLAQEALVNAYVASGSFRGAARFQTWVFRIAYHCFIDRIRARKVRTEPLDAFMDAPLPAPDASDGCFRHEDLYRALARLPLRCCNRTGWSLCGRVSGGCCPSRQVSSRERPIRFCAGFRLSCRSCFLPSRSRCTSPDAVCYDSKVRFYRTLLSQYQQRMMPFSAWRKRGW